MVYYLFIENKDIHLGILIEALKEPNDNINFSSKKFGILKQDYIQIKTQMYDDVGIYNIIKKKLNNYHIYKFEILKDLTKKQILLPILE